MTRIPITVALLTAMIGAASAVDEPQRSPAAALAKKCRELAVKAHPRAVAGSKTGTAKAEREYFAACISKNGEMGK
jgi:hypothetical protein